MQHTRVEERDRVEVKGGKQPNKEQSPVRESWVKEGQKVSGDQNALILPSRTSSDKHLLHRCTLIVDAVADSK